MPKRSSGEISFYTSTVLDKAGVTHGFFMRLGGVSLPPFDSLNVKIDPGDSPKNVMENRRRICASLGIDAQQLVFASLAHSDGVKVASSADAGQRIEGFDALISQTPGLPLMLSVADCVPIILVQPDKLVALIHASWRSIIAGIIPEALTQITRLHIQPSNLVAAIGPCIATQHYEIKADVIGLISEKLPFHDKVLISSSGKTFFDLRKTCQLQLQTGGVTQIDQVPIDTFSNTEEFYSYRKEGKTGRFAVVATL